MEDLLRSKLVERAVDARQFAYAPYSNYQVGAAILAKSGKIYSGCNVENASYGLCLCAERTAIVKAVSEGDNQFDAIVVATEGGGTPCGACRQFIAEFCNDEMLVIVHDVTKNESQDFNLHQLLPNAFRLNA